MATPPFTDAEQPEVCARVVYQFVRLAYRRDRQAYTDNYRAALKRDLLPLLCWKNPVLSCAAWALQYHLCSTSVNSLQWLDHALNASRCGLTFRACYYPNYKRRRKP